MSIHSNPLVPLQLEVNGSHQSFLFRLRSDLAPVIFWLHGGPGSTLMPWTVPFDEPILRYFSVVHWDQRGAGMSLGPSQPPETLSLEIMVKDAIAAVTLVKQRIGHRPLVLAGHSWGTFLALQVAKECPELITKLILVGTLVNLKLGDKLKVEFLKKVGLDEPDIKNLSDLGQPPYSDLTDVLFINQLLLKHQAIFGNLTLDQLGSIQNKSNVYSVENWKVQEIGASQSIKSLFPELSNYHASHQHAKIAVPTVFIQGSLDMATPTSLVKEFFEQTEAPNGKTWLEMMDCAHFPMWESPDEFTRLLKNIL